MCYIYPFERIIFPIYLVLIQALISLDIESRSYCIPATEKSTSIREIYSVLSAANIIIFNDSGVLIKDIYENLQESKCCINFIFWYEGNLNELWS